MYEDILMCLSIKNANISLLEMAPSYNEVTQHSRSGPTHFLIHKYISCYDVLQKNSGVTPHTNQALLQT